MLIPKGKSYRVLHCILVYSDSKKFSRLTSKHEIKFQQSAYINSAQNYFHEYTNLTYLQNFITVKINQYTIIHKHG